MPRDPGKNKGTGGAVKNFVAVVFAEDREQAQLYKTLLENNDIPVAIKGEEPHLAGERGIAVMVPEDYLDEAHVLIESQEAFDDFYDYAGEDTFDDELLLDEFDVDSDDDFDDEDGF
ncbi:MAG: DUF2007 domain-containing protein [Planctomycetota bacterium]